MLASNTGYLLRISRLWGPAGAHSRRHRLPPWSRAASLDAGLPADGWSGCLLRFRRWRAPAGEAGLPHGGRSAGRIASIGRHFQILRSWMQAEHLCWQGPQEQRRSDRDPGASPGGRRPNWPPARQHLPSVILISKNMPVHSACPWAAGRMDCSTGHELSAEPRVPGSADAGPGGWARRRVGRERDMCHSNTENGSRALQPDTPFGENFP